MIGAAFLDRLQSELARLEAGALVALAHAPDEPDVAPFARGARLGEAFVVVPAAAPPRLGYWTPMEREEAAATGLALLTPEQLELPRRAREHPDPDAYLAAVLGAALRICGVVPGVVALAGSWPAGSLVAAAERLTRDGWRFVAGSEALRFARKRKSAAELAEMARVAKATCEAFRLVARRLAVCEVRNRELHSEGERLTVGRIKAEIAVRFARDGLTQPREPIVAPGEEAAVPHSAGTSDRVLRSGESLLVDLFPKGKLFADCTRTFCVGTPPEPLAKAHADTLSALALAHERAAPGVRGWDLQQAVCARLAERGWPTPVDAPGALRGYVHNLGHGVGYELHELPSFKESATDRDGLLEAGDAVTLEPGLYEPSAGGFGVRLEDLVILGEAGQENLTPLPYALDPRAWQR